MFAFGSNVDFLGTNSTDETHWKANHNVKNLGTTNSSSGKKPFSTHSLIAVYNHNDINTYIAKIFENLHFPHPNIAVAAMYLGN